MAIDKTALRAAAIVGTIALNGLFNLHTVNNAAENFPGCKMMDSATAYFGIQALPVFFDTTCPMGYTFAPKVT